MTDEKLKEFMLNHFDFTVLKKVGFYGKDIKRNDYQAQADRICWYFGYQSVYEYPEITITEHGNWGTVETTGHVSPKGEYVPGIVGHLSLINRKSND